MKSKILSILIISVFVFTAIGCTVAVAPVSNQSGNIIWAFLFRQEIMGVKVAVPLFQDNADVEEVVYEGDNVIFASSKLSDKDGKIGIRFTRFGKLNCSFDIFIMNDKNEIGLRGSGSMNVGSDIRYAKNSQGLVTGVYFQHNDAEIKIKGFSVEKLLFSFDSIPTSLSILGGSSILWNDPGVVIVE
jgi:hypothetical protein